MTLGSAILTTGANNATTTYSGGILGTGGLTKTGTGTFTLSGTSTYTGPTTVARHAVGERLDRLVERRDGERRRHARRHRHGRPRRRSSGGTLSPGNSIGTITINGNLTFVGAGNYIVEVSPTARRPHQRDRHARRSPARCSAVGTGGAYTIGNALHGAQRDRRRQRHVRQPRRSSAASASPSRASNYDANNVYLVLDPNAISPSLAGGTPNQRAVARRDRCGAAGGSQPRRSPRCSASPPRSFPARSTSSPARCMRAPRACWWTRASMCAPRCSAACARRPTAATRSMASLALGGPQAFARRTRRSTARSPTRKSPIVAKAPMQRAGARAATSCSGRRASAPGASFNGDGNAASVRRDLAGFFTGVDTRVGAQRPRSASRPATPARSNNARRPRHAPMSRPGTSPATAAGASARSTCAPAAPTRSTPSTPTARSRSRASSIARPRTTTAAPGRSSARPATALRSAMSRSSRSRAPPGCASTTDAAAERGGAGGAQRRRRTHSRSAIRRSASAPPA